MKALHRLLRAALGAAFFVSAPAMAEAICGPRAAALEYLLERYGERPRAAGLAGDGRVVELLVSASGSWTLLLVRPDGTACIAAGGEAWQDTPAPRPEPRS